MHLDLPILFLPSWQTCSRCFKVQSFSGGVIVLSRFFYLLMRTFTVSVYDLESLLHPSPGLYLSAVRSCTCFVSTLRIMPSAFRLNKKIKRKSDRPLFLLISQNKRSTNTYLYQNYMTGISVKYIHNEDALDLDTRYKEYKCCPNMLPGWTENRSQGEWTSLCVQ